MLEQNDIARLAAAIHHLRPDWPQASLFTFITRHLAGRALRDVAVALTWVATDPTTEKPARVLEAGPWWQATNSGTSTHRPPRFGETCRFHPGHYAHNCGGCRADQIAGEQRPPQPAAERGTVPPPDAYRAARQAVRAPQEPQQ